MTDVYIAYAREDRERVRPLAESLQTEGWDVWWDPTEPSASASAALDQRLGSAGSILVVWSASARGSEYVRSEAATGLYKNKLIQVRIDSTGAPRPFDQVEVVNLGRWQGERDDENWRRVLSAVRLYAGAPGIARPQPVRRPGVRAPSKPAYLEQDRAVAWGPLAAAAALVVAGGAIWVADPFGWRDGEGAHSASAEAAPAAAPADLAALTPERFEDTEASEARWASLDREDPQALRDLVTEHPRSSHAESARSLLRVLDAQSWVEAVTADNEAGYTAYLKNFPVEGSLAGAMAGQARDRLVSLNVERVQAIEDIQRGLASLDLYKDEIDGKGGPGTVRAIRSFASGQRISVPSLTSSAPRDLRSFADRIRKEAGGRASASNDISPIVAAATTPARTERPSPSAAAQADQLRVAEAQAAARRATEAAEEEEKDQAEGLAAATLSRLDAEAWSVAQRVGTAGAFQSYLASYPSGSQAAAARAAIQSLSRPAAYSIDQVAPGLRASVEAARNAEVAAKGRAQAARETAAATQSAANLRSITSADGDRYETQIANGAPNGLGLRVSGDTASLGDRYRGELRNGQSSGLGVYEFADNPNNARAGAQRYEGEHTADGMSGFGVTYWRNGDSFAGSGASGATARGVLTFANGQRYEGETRNGVRNGLGVVWSGDGQILQAGRWENGQLVEPMAAPGTIALGPPLP